MITYFHTKSSIRDGRQMKQPLSHRLLKVGIPFSRYGQ